MRLNVHVSGAPCAGLWRLDFGFAGGALLAGLHANPAACADEDSDDADKADEGIADEDEDAAEKKEDKPKEKRYENVVDWELLNGNKALWLRDAKEVEEEEYAKFFSALNNVRQDVTVV